MSMREQFVRTTTEAMDADPRVALVLAEISADRFTDALDRHSDRVFNVGIREQAMVGVAGGLALAGMRPVLHSITPFVVERPFEQLKLDLGHQGVGAIAVSTGASYDYPTAGRTHMAPGDVALIDTLPGWTVHVPGHPDEVDALLSREFGHDSPAYLRLSDRANAEPLVTGPGWHPVRGVGERLGDLVGGGAPQVGLDEHDVRARGADGGTQAVGVEGPDGGGVEDGDVHRGGSGASDRPLRRRRGSHRRPEPRR